MKIKRIKFITKVKDINNDNIDVLVENEDGYQLHNCRRDTRQDLLEEMNQEKINYVIHA
jgi:hypothetical protein